MPLLLNSFSSRCGMYFAQCVHALLAFLFWVLCFLWWSDVCVTIGLYLSLFKWVSFNSFLILFCDFLPQCCVLASSGSSWFYRDKDSHDPAWTFLVLQCFPCWEFFFLIFELCFVWLFFFYWGILLRVSTECLCSCKSWVVFYWFQLG